MKLSKLVLAMALALLVTPNAWAQSTYNGELIFNQFDFRQFDVLGSGPLTGGTVGNTVVIASQGGTYSPVGTTGPNNVNSLDWSISIPVSAAQAMVTGTGVTSYTGSFTYGQPSGPATVIGAGQLNGAVSGNTVTMRTVNGRLGVNGVNPNNTTADDWNTANFNWSINIPVSTLKQYLGQ